MATKAITIRVDDAIKDQAETMLNDIGINMTTFIVSCLKALIRERKIPFEMVTTQYSIDQMILEKLIEAEREAADPDTIWVSHNEVFKRFREQYDYEV